MDYRIKDRAEHMIKDRHLACESEDCKTKVRFLIGVIIVLILMLAFSIYQNQQLLNAWSKAQDYWQSLPLVYP